MYHNKVFRSISNTDNGEVSSETIFTYHQEGEIVTAEYSGGAIVKGHLLARVLPTGQLDMRYHHLNRAGEFMLGKCLSAPEILPDGRIKLKEEWQWLTGDRSAGYSEVEEIDRKSV